ncbi:hypothetical protein ASD11_04445 [Aeromicrobium sp. Root495]|nr:hypothetical protein ASD11_04445 [Aeromicrobium sp. Root495]
MKAEPSSQLVLLDLQAQDATLLQLAHRRSSLPELAQLKELGTKAAELDSQRVAALTKVQDLTRAQKKADHEVEQVKARRQRDEERMASGAISSPKDLANMQHELTALERRIGTLEDEEIEIMEQLEEAQTALDAITADLDALKTDIAHAEAARDAALTAIEEQSVLATAARGTLVAEVPDDLLALYDKLRAQYGSGAAALQARRCEGCRLELNSADLRDIAAQPIDDVVRCPECSRILVRTAESGL